MAVLPNVINKGTWGHSKSREIMGEAIKAYMEMFLIKSNQKRQRFGSG
jgi:hypothetical protein